MYCARMPGSIINRNVELIRKFADHPTHRHTFLSHRSSVAVVRSNFDREYFVTKQKQIDLRWRGNRHEHLTKSIRQYSSSWKEKDLMKIQNGNTCRFRQKLHQPVLKIRLG